MSFILDALKKSEVERQRQSVPGLMDIGPAPRRARFPLWAIALAALLAVNLAVLIVVLARGGLPGLTSRRAGAASASSGAVSESVPGSSGSSGSPGPRPGAQALPAPPPAGAQAPYAVPGDTAAPAASTATAADPHFSPMDAATPVYAPEIPAESGPTAPSGAAGQSSRATSPEAPAPRGRDPTLVSGGDKSDQEVLPTISELDLTGANALPELHLDVHVYATRPAERFVYINMQKYREGSTIAEGPLLERIRRDGVVLDYRGLRFLLPRQQ
jgi:general secretion pathway protein B